MMIINNRKIDRDQNCYIIAEISANHGQNLEFAKNLIVKAVKAGADAIKIQCYTPDGMTINCDKDDFEIKDGLWKGYSLYNLYEKGFLKRKQIIELKEFADKEKITLFPSIFTKNDLDFCEKLDMPAYKISSFESEDHVLMKEVIETNKPLIISTGILNDLDLDFLVDFLVSNGYWGNTKLLSCISKYPTKNIYVPDFKKSFCAGISDHSLSLLAPSVAVAKGAYIVEKHVTLSRHFNTLDCKFSLNIEEFEAMVRNIRETEYILKNKQKKIDRVFARSIYVVENIKKGEKLSNSNIKKVRPGYGLPAYEYEDVIGKEVLEDLEIGTALKWEMVK